MGDLTDEQLNLLAALASGYQNIDDRTKQLETVFKDSMIIPASVVRSILLAAVIVLLFAIMM